MPVPRAAIGCRGPSRKTVPTATRPALLLHFTLQLFHKHLTHVETAIPPIQNHMDEHLIAVYFIALAKFEHGVEMVIAGMDITRREHADKMQVRFVFFNLLDRLKKSNVFKKRAARNFLIDARARLVV